MSLKPENPFAFPFTERDGGGAHYHSHGGMSLRDHFAGQALPGAMQKYQTASLIAEYCYQVADAMLAERAKEQP